MAIDSSSVSSTSTVGTGSSGSVWSFEMLSITSTKLNENILLVGLRLLKCIFWVRRSIHT